MRKKRRFGVLLKGGLGNQLFQIAAGINSANGESVEILSKFTLPRETNGTADALYFKFPDEIVENPIRSSRIERKGLAISLRLALSQKSSVYFLLLQKSVSLANDLLFSMKFKGIAHVNSGVGTGFCKIVPKPGLNLLNGYFQAHQFLLDGDTFRKMQRIEIIEKSESLICWINLAKIERPLIIHLRLGDYKNEKGIGLLPRGYYDDAFKLLGKKTTSRNLWIFTEEPESVDQFVNPPSGFNVKVVGEIGLNPAETLELMRYGSAYVIANSTFSWWAAFLSYESGCTTIMPSPWFQHMPSPDGIKPQNWKEIEYLK